MANNSDRNNQGTTIEPKSLVQRVIAGARYALSSKVPNAWMGPGEPMRPVAQETQGRRLDYGTFINTNTTPKFNEGVTFSQLRSLADLYDPLRLVIESRKDQMAKQRWIIKSKDKKAKPDPRCDELTAMFAVPDGQNEWGDWLRMLIEDMLVIDAVCIYPRQTIGGQLFSFEVVDGATIKVIIDANGRRPMAPDPAYQQNIKGMAASNYTADELVYKPRNLRTNRLYGYSPVEQVVNTVNVGLRRQLSQLNYFTDGTVPDAFMGTPEGWSTDQIRGFQDHMDNLLSNDQAKRRRVRYVPGESAKTYTETKAPPLKDQFDEWLTRIICYAFSVDVTPFVAQVNRATAETNREQSLSEGLEPLLNWVRSLMNLLLAKYCGAPDLEFAWEEESSVSPVEQANVLKIYVDSKIITVDEARETIGREPMSAEQLAVQAEQAAAAMAAAQQGMMGGDPNAKPGDKPAFGSKKPAVDEKVPAEKIEVHIHNSQPDIFVDVAGTTVNATIGDLTKSATSGVAE